MWLKSIFIFFLFWFFAILQNSFFVHFSLFGAAPNLVFVLFFLILFFEKRNSYFQIIFCAILAGLFLDFFSYTYLGTSIVLLLIIGFLAKSVQSSLQEKRNDKFPFIYFLSLFFVSIIIYKSLLAVMINKFNLTQFILIPNLAIGADVVYNLLIASIAFYLYKKFLALAFDDRQLRLIK